jgi:hypothetical protein
VKIVADTNLMSFAFPLHLRAFAVQKLFAEYLKETNT